MKGKALLTTFVGVAVYLLWVGSQVCCRVSGFSLVNSTFQVDSDSRRKALTRLIPAAFQEDTKPQIDYVVEILDAIYDATVSSKVVARSRLILIFF